MDAKIINPFLNATLNVLKTMASTEATPGKPVAKGSARTFGCVTGVIGMAGDQLTGNLLISFDEPSILAIVSRMLMEQFSTVNQDVVDAVGEITNMVCGGAKKELSEHGFKFELATPIIVTGQNVELQQMSKAPILSIPFKTPEGNFVVDTNLGPKGTS